MPLLNGLEATRQIRKACPATRVLILSAHSDDAYIEQVEQLGAAGFLVKQTSSHVLASTIREIQKGRTFFSPAISKRMLGRSKKLSGREGQSKKSFNRLSSREVEVLQLIAEGYANKQIADRLSAVRNKSRRSPDLASVSSLTAARRSRRRTPRRRKR